MQPEEKVYQFNRENSGGFPRIPTVDGRFTEINPHLTIGHELGERFDEASEITKEIKNNYQSKQRPKKSGLWNQKTECGKSKKNFSSAIIAS